MIEALILAVPATLSAMAAWRKSAKTQKRVDTEFSPNHGTSARDLLDAIAAKQIAQDEKLDLIHESFLAHLRDHRYTR